ncbi:MAG: hypothetical protein AB1728_09605, partial [Bacteroidota bacterium]
MSTRMNITYLMGAGASWNALPLVKEIPKSLNDFMHDFIRFANNYNGKDKALIDEIITELGNLKKESERHYSIDTYAKKLTVR